MKKKINIVLYSPEIPQNTGNISRTCSVTGAALHIIKPIGFEISDRTLKRAGLDYESYGEFAASHADAEIYFFSSHAKKFYTDVEYGDEVYLVFGKESCGIPRELVEENKERALRIPMLEDRRCLNLSNSVAIAVYEVLRQDGFCGLV